MLRRQADNPLRPRLCRGVCGGNDGCGVGLTPALTGLAHLVAGHIGEHRVAVQDLLGQGRRDAGVERTHRIVGRDGRPRLLPLAQVRHEGAQPRVGQLGRGSTESRQPARPGRVVGERSKAGCCPGDVEIVVHG